MKVQNLSKKYDCINEIITLLIIFQKQHKKIYIGLLHTK